MPNIDAVSAGESYNREKFQKAVKSYSQLRELIGEAEKNTRDKRLLENIGELLRDDSQFYLDMVSKSGQWTGDMGLKSDLEQAVSAYGGSLRGYAGKNLESVLKDFDDDRLDSLVKILPIVPKEVLKLPRSQFLEVADLFAYKPKNKLGKALNEFALVQGYLARGDEDDFNHYIVDRLQKLEGSEDPYDQFLTRAYLNGRGIPGYTQQTMRAYARQAEFDVKKELYKTKTSGKGKDKKIEEIFKTDIVRSFISEAYKKAKDEIKASYADKVVSLAA